MCPISKSTNTASINIDSLGLEVRDFVIKYEQGSRQASQLVSSEALQVRETIVQQSGKTEDALQEHVTRTSARFEEKLGHHIEQASRERLRESVLKSLKYHGMNERANQVENAHVHTFGWLFADADDSNEVLCRSNTNELDYQDASSENAWSDIDTDDDDEEQPEMVWSSFTDWLQSDLSIYWIMGKPGSGKSTLAKFILSEPRMIAALEKWRPGAILVSHFFWRPGALLQRSIKGMLCSIIYQLMLSLPSAVEYALANVAGLSQKDGDTDWSVSELQELCLGLMRNCGKPLCLFIDGLDECGPEDEHQRLLDDLERFRLPNVKIIASSRNEPVFEERFRHEPQLRVQDLTSGDLRIYATDMLIQDVKADVREELVANAEGVFLWLVLSVQSINRGFRNGDSFEDLRKRIRSLPRGLNDLYKDMWERLNEDRELYRKSAALYFKLAMARDDTELNCLKHGWSALEMMLASFAEDHAAFAGRPVISGSLLMKQCIEFHKRVIVRCAGLLGLCGEPEPNIKLEDWKRALFNYANPVTNFRFIHRSARDFLVDTVDGQNILIHDKTSPEDIKISIVSARIRVFEILGMILGSEARSWFSFESDYSQWRSLSPCIIDLSIVADARESAARDLVPRCYELYRSRQLSLRHKDGRSAHPAAFFGEAAAYPNLNHHCIPIIKNQLVGRNIRSAILLSVATAGRGKKTVELVRWLLSQPDVDVNLKCPLVAPRVVREAAFDSGIMGPLDHIKESPFNRLLGLGLRGVQRRALQPELFWNRYPLIGLVSDFAFKGADFHSTLFLATSMRRRSQSKGSPQTAISRFHQLAGERLSDEASDANGGDDSFLCVVSMQASTVIQRMLASLPTTQDGHISIDEHEHSPSEDDYSVSDLQAGIQFLTKKCQEYAGETSDRVIGFVELSGDVEDMPYQQVSDQDSAQILEIIWAHVFGDSPRDWDFEAACTEVATRSPFSSIGLRDYLRERGCFDGRAAQKLVKEYRKGIVTSLLTHTIRVLAVANN